MDGLRLNDVEVRVLGSLVEKEITTPEYYPLSLNALTNACNQINNRDPVVTFGEAAVLKAVESLRDKRLAYVLSGGVSRVLKYGHKAPEVLALSRPELAILCVLLLRGPQTVGELRGRSGRMQEFATLAEVDAVLQSLAARPVPLVVCLPRQAGTKESRYAHLLAGEVGNPAAAPAPPPEAPDADPDRVAALEREVASLRAQLTELHRQFAEFRKELG